jgi:leucyl aminopeptidase (aminopeptidase T)
LQLDEKIKMFEDVFAPKSGEKILILVDIPHNDILDNKTWKKRREMAKEWYESFKEMGKKIGFTVDFQKYNATGLQNNPIPKDVLNKADDANLVIAMTEFSGSSSFVTLCNKKNSNTRIVSMPGVEKRMENTAFRANYAEVNSYANSIKKMLTKAIGAEIIFSTGDTLFIDLRNRKGMADIGDCSKTGQFINFPSGEGFIAPYEGAPDEIEKYQESKTKGILPDNQYSKLIKYSVEKNKIMEVIGKGKDVEERREFFKKNDSRRNIAELGIGCNPRAVVTGNTLEDEKVGGLHIAYGNSNHIGGKTKSDVHIDICFPKGLPVEAKTLTLINDDKSKIELIRNSRLRYELLRDNNLIK